MYNQYQADLARWNATPARRRGRPPAVVARPGTSAHEAGMGFDLPSQYRTARVVEIFAEHNFNRPILNIDAWHFEWTGWRALSAENRTGHLNQAQTYYTNCVNRRR